MPGSPTNGDGRDLNRPSASTGPHESAALLLVESLIHGLIDRSVLSLEEAIEIIEIAAEVEREQDPDPFDGATLPARPSLLMPMADSLRFDLKD